MLSNTLKLNRKTLIFMILLLSLALRLAWISTLKHDRDYFGEEGCQDAAVSMLQGKGYVMPPFFDQNAPPMYAFRVPAFALFLAGTYLIFGIYNYLAATILLAILGTLTCMLVYFIAKMLFDEKVALLALIIASVFPSSIYWAGFLAPENLVVFLLALTVFFLLKSLDSPSWVNYVLAGLFWGITSLARPHTLLFLPFFLIYLLFAFKKRKEALKKFAVICAVAIIPAVIWTARNYRIYHEIVPMETLNGEAFYCANNPEAIKSWSGIADFTPAEAAIIFKGKTDLEIGKWYWKKALEWIKANPLLYLKAVGNRFLRYWRFWPHLGAGIDDNTYTRKHLLVGLFVIAPVILLGAAGIFLSLKNWRKTLLLYLLILQYSCTHILVRVVLRYREPVMPYIIIFASYALCFLWEKFRHGTQKTASI